ncbi:hypothetical protein OIDMADRAFT_34639 [Oidiodendron maius Zn]|uniref:Uncharacterized protein n=1 Tax=Oidiodendron maius (strain Zn) TaxID=913774 RepID=A0A0C3CYA5_OIDMZ|nr:hypothetical protein OIDMADRAFT_34639 [Oidiodendron maius Zn]
MIKLVILYPLEDISSIADKCDTRFSVPSTQATYVVFQHNNIIDEFRNFLTLCPSNRRCRSTWAVYCHFARSLWVQERSCRAKDNPPGATKSFGGYRYKRQDKGVKWFTPEPLVNISQPKLEAFLRSYAKNTGLVTIYDACALLYLDCFLMYQALVSKGDSPSNLENVIRTPSANKGSLLTMTGSVQVKFGANSRLDQPYSFTSADSNFNGLVGDYWTAMNGLDNTRPQSFMAADHPVALNDLRVTEIIVWPRLPSVSSMSAMIVRTGHE